MSEDTPTTDEVFAALHEAGIDTVPACRWLAEVKRRAWEQGRDDREVEVERLRAEVRSKESAISALAAEVDVAQMRWYTVTRAQVDEATARLRHYGVKKRDLKMATEAVMQAFDLWVER